MKTTSIRLGLVTLLAGLAVSGLEAQQRTFEWSQAMDDGLRLEVRGISGDIEATLARGDVAEVVAEKSGRSSDFHAVEIEVHQMDGVILVCADYSNDVANTSCRDGNRGDRDDHDDREIRVSVDFEVRVPAGVEFRGGTVSGDVTVDDLRSDVRASTVSGDVDVSTTGVAHGTTVSGNVDVRMGSLAWDDLDFSTVSGDITVWMPSDLDAEIEFSSLSGEFESDFPVRTSRTRNKFVGSELDGVIGDGGRSLSFKTVSGDVELRRGRSAVR